jgi:hypothetical protein
MSNFTTYLFAATAIAASDALNATMALAAAGGIIGGFFIGLTVFFASDPNSTRKNALVTSAIIALLAGATIGVMVVLLRDTGVSSAPASLMLKSIGFAMLASVLTSEISLLFIRRAYAWMYGKPVKSGSEAREWARKSDRLRY